MRVLPNIICEVIFTRVAIKSLIYNPDALISLSFLLRDVYKPPSLDMNIDLCSLKVYACSALGLVHADTTSSTHTG